MWKSPLESDQFAEYRDDDFLAILEIKNALDNKLIDFWPKRGPQWDALGCDGTTYYIVEAKANIPEIVSPGSTAGPDSLARIQDSFSEVKEYLGIENSVDWSKTFYQYANRIAHLYFLRVLNGLDANLLFIYFIDDQTIEGPKSPSEWQAAIQVVEKYLGIPKRHKLRKFIHEIFISINDLK